MKADEIITDAKIHNVHADAGFEGMDKRDVVNQAVLKCACGLYQGSTSEAIIKEHGLINPQGYNLSIKGKAYLWAVYGDADF